MPGKLIFLGKGKNEQTAEKAKNERSFSTMRKNKMMRLASGLLVAVLLTTCTISGTFAKYVTSAKADSSARVAKFGVEVTAEVAPFLAEYDADSFKLCSV